MNTDRTLHAVLFDVDGTLADTEQDGHRPAFNAAFKQLGLDWNWDIELYGKLLKVTGGKERIHHFINGRQVFGRSGRRGDVYNPARGIATGAIDLASVEVADVHGFLGQNGAELAVHVRKTARPEDFPTLDLSRPPTWSRA